MKIFWNIFEIVATVFEAFISVRFLLRFQDYNFSTKSAKLKYIYISLTYAVLLTMVDFVLHYSSVLPSTIIYIAFCLIVSAIFVESKIVSKIFASVIDILVMLAVASVVPGMFSAALKMPLSVAFSEKSWVRLICVILTQFIKVFVYDVILKAVQRKNLMLNKKEWTLILIIFALSFTTVALSQIVAINMNSDLEMILVIEVCSIVIAAVCFYMTALLNKAHKESEQLKLTAQQDVFRSQYADNVKKQYEEISRVRHDMKQTNSVVLALLSEAKTEEAIEYMQKSAQKISEFDVVIDTGNDFVNAILNAKLSEAKHRGITVLCTADKNAAGIDEVDLCNLLGNMLDNSIESCEKCRDKQRVIEIQIRLCRNKYLIDVENTAPENAFENNKLLSTTKENKDRHGYGIKSIKSIAEKYNGMVSFSQTADRFRSTVALSIGQ